jgi:hypothetical protein
MFVAPRASARASQQTCISGGADAAPPPERAKPDSGPPSQLRSLRIVAVRCAHVDDFARASSLRSSGLCRLATQATGCSAAARENPRRRSHLLNGVSVGTEEADGRGHFLHPRGRRARSSRRLHLNFTMLDRSASAAPRPASTQPHVCRVALLVDAARAGCGGDQPPRNETTSSPLPARRGQAQMPPCVRAVALSRARRE